LLVFLLLAAPAGAAVSGAVSVEEMARTSDAVVHGSVVGSRSAWTPDGRHLRTRVTLRRLAAWRGQVPDVLELELPGGKVGDVAQVISGAPAFEPGEEVVVFLRTAGSGGYRVVGLSLGKFRVVGTEARPALDELIVQGGALRAGERPVEPMPLAELERRVRAP
jgi:hypothetical protein